MGITSLPEVSFQKYTQSIFKNIFTLQSFLIFTVRFLSKERLCWNDPCRQRHHRPSLGSSLSAFKLASINSRYPSLGVSPDVWICVHTRRARAHALHVRFSVGAALRLQSPSLMPSSRDIQPPLALHPLRALWVCECACIKWLLNQEGIVSLHQRCKIEGSLRNTCSHGYWKS